MTRKWLHYALCLSILSAPAYSLPAQAAPPAAVQNAAAIEPLLKKPYLELLELAPTLRHTPQQFQEVRKRLKSEQEKKEKDLKAKQKSLDSQIVQGDGCRNT